MNKKVSVALATYNGEKYILKQLESLLHQSFKIDEVIICDDQSTDATVDIILSYIKENDLNWKLYINKKNLGYKKNFYHILEMVSGDYIFLCDQDDIWDYDKVNECMNIFNSHAQVKCINTSFECINENDESINNFSFIKKKSNDGELYSIIFEEIVIHNIAMGCTMAFHKDIKDFYLSKSQCIAAHDWEINFIASLVNGLYFYNKPLMKYRIHNQNTTGIDTLNSNDRVNSRIKNSIEIDQYLNSIYMYNNFLKKNQRDYLEKCIKFSKKRVIMLTEKKTANWFYLIRNIRLYSQYISKKGMFLEFYLTLK